MPTEDGHLTVCITEEALTEVTPEGDVRSGLDLADLIGNTQSRLHPLFGESQERLRRRAADLRPRYGPAIPDLSRFYAITTEDTDRQRDPGTFAEELAAMDIVETAYFKPEPELPSNGAPPFPTPDFSALQGYLEPAPRGIDAYHAWTYPGGHGDGVRIIDIEKSWRFTHEDLLYNLNGGALNSAPDNVAWRNHGTAVVGILGGDVNSFGIRGICPAAAVGGMSIREFGGSARAIARAADRLSRGDIILIEIHGQGPLTDEEAVVAAGDPGLTLGYLPAEFWPEDFAAIKYATNRGVVVVSAAGNGRRDLDGLGAIVTGPAAGWTNPFERDTADSGTILVGGGAAPPPVGAGPDRSRLEFSNFGSCLDAQGWGHHVVTTGGRADQGGDLQGGPYEDRWYTNSFAGTSSAAPIVAGALACVQGILGAAGHARLTPKQARDLLRASGSPQMAETDGSLRRIGTRPNLQELIPRALESTGPAGPEDEAEGGYGGYCAPGVAIFVGGCGGWSDWELGRWRGPGWELGRWRGPGWDGGPGWRGRRVPGPYDREGPFGAGEVVPDAPGIASATSTGGRRAVGRPGF
jgi:Subtilase family